MGPLVTLLLAVAPVNLQWAGPAGCPAQEAVVAEVVRLLPATTTVAEPLEAQAVVSTTATGRWRAELSVAGAGRAFEAASCAELADATALVLAMAIDPSVEPPAPPPVPDAGVEPADAGAAPLPVDAGAPASPELSLRPFVRAQVSALVGPMPTLAVVPGGAVGVQLGRLSFEGRFGVSLSQRVLLAAKAGAGADLQLVRGGLRGCFTVLERAVSLSGCGGLDLGSLRGRSFGVTTPATGSAISLGAALGPSARWSPLEHLAVWLELEGQLGLARPSFTIEGLGLVHQVPLLGFATSGGVEVRW